MSFFFHAIDALALVLKLYKAYTNKYLESSWKKTNNTPGNIRLL
jgi:hypothetical protein